MITDSFGRTLDYLRVSVTDRCNLRCVYCMPSQGVEWKPHETMLSSEEFLRICGIMAGLGIRRIKVTGGEPLVRRGIAAFVKDLKALPGIEKVTITTNGILLGAYLDEAEALGALPDGVNISLDALDNGRFRRITRRAENESPSFPEDLLPLIDRLLVKGIPVKLNCVPIRGFNEEEILPLAALARDKNIAVRFIELMPLGSAAAMEPIPGDEIASLLEKAYGALTPFPGSLGGGPALYYSLPGFAGKVGFINAVTHGFCETCNRLRLTSEGFLKPCLSYDSGLDLRALLRAGGEARPGRDTAAPSGVSDAELARAITEAAAKKPQFHTFSGVYGTAQAGHSGGMYRIGG